MSFSHYDLGCICNRLHLAQEMESFDTGGHKTSIDAFAVLRRGVREGDWVEKREIACVPRSSRLD